MTDETPPTGPEESVPSEPTPAPEPPAPASTGGSDFTTGEGLVALAGIILLLDWLIFDVFIDEYGLNVLELLLAVVVVVVPRLNPNLVEKVHPVPVIMKTAGYAIAVVGAIFVISALEEGFYDDAATIIAALINYAAYAMAFLGARQIEV